MKHPTRLIVAPFILWAGYLYAEDIESPDPSADLIDSRIYLLHSPDVHDALELKSKQQDQLRILLNKIQRPLWRLRDVDPRFVESKHRETVAALVAEINDILPATEQLLNERQRERLDELTLRWEGLPALKQDKWADAVKLDAGQKRAIRQAGERTFQALALIHNKKKGSIDAETMQKVMYKLNEKEADAIESQLSKEQKRRLRRLMGKPFNFKRMDRRIYRAPEFEGVTAWINSEPLKMADLRGRVVAVHFWTHVCINCRNNYPQMHRWYERFADDDVVMVGIHTPEVQSDRKLENIRAAAVRDQLNYPIAVDNDLKNWTNWDNHVWPSVYLVDKDGFIRYWWYGELGEEGDQLFADHIRDLEGARWSEPEP